MNESSKVSPINKVSDIVYMIFEHKISRILERGN